MLDSCVRYNYTLKTCTDVHDNCKIFGLQGCTTTHWSARKIFSVLDSRFTFFIPRQTAAANFKANKMVTVD